MFQQVAIHSELMPVGTFARDGLLNSSINTCTFATDGTGDITVASAHGLAAGDQVRFSTTVTLPGEISINGRYYVLAAGLTTTKLRIATTPGGSVITFAGAGTGTHSIWKNSLWEAFQLSLGYQGLYAAIPAAAGGGDDAGFVGGG